MGKSSDLLDSDLSETPTWSMTWSARDFRPLFKGLDDLGDLYFDPIRLHVDALGHKKLDITSYSCGDCSLLNSGKVRRLLTGLIGKTTHFPNTEHRILLGLHTKLILGYSLRGVPEAAYLGSQNAVKPTTLNLSVRITNKDKLSRLVKYFNILWKHAK